MSDQTIDSQLLYVVFFLLTCIDAVIHAVLHHFLNHSHMPFEPHNMLEWGTACYFASAANPQLQTVIKELMIFQLLLIILLNTFGILNLLHRFRIVPTSIIGFAKIIHFVHLVVIRRQWYPMMFYLEMLAETLILIHIVLYTLIQLLGNWISGTTSTNSTMFFNINLSDDWNSVFKNWVERFALLANDTGFKNQLDPILFPIGLGLPPSLFIDLKTKVNPFHNNLMNQWKQKSDFINPKNQNLTRVLSLWNSMLSIPLIFIYKHLLKSINFILKLFVHRNVTPIHSESDDDSDYQPDEDQTDNEWTDEDDQEFIETTENNNSQITTNSRLDEDSDNLELYKELFELAKDNYNHSNQLRNENPMSMYHALFQNQDMKRQKRSRFTNNRSSTPSTPTISNPSYSSDVRSCVVCQTDQRCIVLRPCGCLSLCDDCRHAMATRHSHLCPCCRTTVIGYQKIYQP
ncbi:hypothetical protein BC833DRAFT_600684 [Globomyces pollinis-pini]|nr:hypothetical protein BC833DRAFT_600684 [Globomyces pollinis-pini]